VRKQVLLELAWLIEGYGAGVKVALNLAKWKLENLWFKAIQKHFFNLFW
jgi:hypothetical protein